MGTSGLYTERAIGPRQEPPAAGTVRMALPSGHGAWETGAEDEARRAAKASRGGEPDIFWRNPAMKRVLVFVFLSAVLAVGATLFAIWASTYVRSHRDSAHPLTTAVADSPRRA